MCRGDECCYSGNDGDVVSGCYSCCSDLKGCCGCDVGMKVMGRECVMCSEGECCGRNMSGDVIKNCSECNSDESKCEKCSTGYSLNKLGRCIEENGEGGGGGGSNTGVIIGIIVSVVVIVVVGSVLLIIFFKSARFLFQAEVLREPSGSSRFPPVLILCSVRFCGWCGA